jgi:protein TonB
MKEEQHVPQPPLCMKRNLVIGGVVAAALHAGVLLGFPRGPVPMAIQDEDVIEVRYPPLPPPEEPPEIIYSAGESRDRENPKPPAPRSADLPDPRLSDFHVETNTRPAVDVPGVVSIPAVDIPSGPGRGSGHGFFESVQLDNPPRTRTQVPPNYPHEARTARLKGEVLVEFTVDEAGRVLNPHIVRSSDRVFDDATLRAVSKWRFEPGRRLGKIVRFRMAVPVVFNLGE